MKICLLATPRSGSKSLMALLQSVFWNLNYYSISEPFNYDHHSFIGSDTHDFYTRILKYERVIIKTLAYQKPNNYENIEDWYKDLFNIFDKVIILDRKDKKKQAESYAFWKSKGYKEYGRWHIPSLYDLSNINENQFIETESFLISQSNTLQNLSQLYNKPLYFYEDIFLEKNQEIINNIFHYIEMERDEYNINKYLISNDLKVRQYQNIKKLI